MIKVVIYDDHRQRCESLKALLSLTEGMECTGTFPDCRNVVEDIRKLQPDIILMDIEMPGVDGISGVLKIKKEFPQVKIIMQTVFEDDDRVFDSICAGASGYILKNFLNTKLIEPDLSSSGRQDELINILKESRPMPAAIWVNSKPVKALIKPVAEILGINLKSGSMPMLAEAKKALLKHFNMEER